MITSQSLKISALNYSTQGQATGTWDRSGHSGETRKIQEGGTKPTPVQQPSPPPAQLTSNMLPGLPEFTRTPPKMPQLLGVLQDPGAPRPWPANQCQQFLPPGGGDYTDRHLLASSRGSTQTSTPIQPLCLRITIKRLLKSLHAVSWQRGSAPEGS